MRGLWKYISPFAPDQSGTAAVLYGLGGIVVICDAGGCAGNICGFDEPRWFSGKKSAVFSAGLRDMDAILGRDDRLIDKLCLAASQIDATFAAIVGTPVPSVIGTDYLALQRMAEKKLDLPILTVDTTGMELYDVGMEKAYDALFHRLPQRDVAKEDNTVGVIGAVPLEMMEPHDVEMIRETLEAQGKVVRMYDCFDDFVHAGAVTKNLVVSPTGIKAAKYLEKTFGIPYEMAYFGLEKRFPQVSSWAQKKILIVHQQTAANALRDYILSQVEADVTVASWFMLHKDQRQDGDIHLKEEDDWCSLADNDTYDIIIGDVYFQKALPHFRGDYIDFPHFAVSGR